MPKNDKNAYLSPEQLCAGLYVHLDLSWIDHPFPFSSFRIKSEDQIKRIHQLGLKRIRYSPERSDSTPLPAAAADREEVVAGNPGENPDNTQSVNDKRQRVSRLRAQRQTISESEREFEKTSQTLKAINQNLLSHPEETRIRVNALAEKMADSLLTSRDIAVSLMPERIAGEESYQHPLNVTVLSLMLARELNASRETIVQLGVGALLHDIGKLNVPERLLSLTSGLSRAEREMTQEHVAHGVGMGRKLGLSQEALAVIAQHHEAVDGSGYPLHLPGERISLLAKIVAVTNTYDNLCNSALPLKKLTPHDALSQMYSQQRERFEPGPLSTFIHCLGVYPPGTLVVLGDEAFGMVMSVNSTRPLRPVVQIYDPDVPREEAILLDLEHEPDLAIRRTIHPSQLPREVFNYLAPRRRIAYYFDIAHSSPPNHTRDTQ